MKWIALAAVAVVSAWAGTAGATVIYSFSGTGSYSNPTDYGQYIPLTANQTYSFLLSSTNPGTGFNPKNIYVGAYENFGYFFEQGAPAVNGGDIIEYNLCCAEQPAFYAEDAINLVQTGSGSLFGHFAPYEDDQTTYIGDVYFPTPTSIIPDVEQISYYDTVSYDLQINIPENTPFTFTVSSIPEPSEWALMIAGLGLVGLGIRRRRFSASLKAQ